VLNNPTNGVDPSGLLHEMNPPGAAKIGKEVLGAGRLIFGALAAGCLGHHRTDTECPDLANLTRAR